MFLFVLQELKEYFRKVGDVSYANAHAPHSGEGVVEFFSKRDMEYALDHKVGQRNVGVRGSPGFLK